MSITIKSKSELAIMREAGRITGGALRYAGENLKPGMSTLDVDKLIGSYFARHGAKSGFKGLYGFPANACISVNDEVIHGIPSKDRVIKSGDIVSIDLGAKINGFNGDNAATFAAGDISPEAKRLCDTTRESLYVGIEKAVAGGRIGDIGSAIASYCEKRGYSVVREYIGHGVGKDLHEDPGVPNFGTPGRGVRLIPGMTIAIEPMINMGKAGVKRLSDGWTVKTKDGSLSAHFEHTVAITPDGPKIMTRI